MAAARGGAAFSARIKELTGKLRAGSVRIGFLEGATNSKTGASIPEYAAANEYGGMVKTKGEDGVEESYFRLPRPFFRNMIAAHKAEWPGAIAKSLKKTKDVEATLELTGAAIGGQLRRSIQDLTSPPLAESTIRRKGFDKPLIDSGEMLAAVDHEVNMK